MYKNLKKELVVARRSTRTRCSSSWSATAYQHILIDCHREILTKNRQAQVLRACLSASRRPEYVRFRLSGLGSSVSALNTTNKQVPDTQVQC